MLDTLGVASSVKHFTHEQPFKAYTDHTELHSLFSSILFLSEDFSTWSIQIE